MKIFFKYVLKSMFEKKGRFILLILAITLSTGLLVASLGTVDIAIDAIAKPQLETYDNKDLYITSKDGSPFFDVSNINNSGIKDVLKEIQISGTLADNKEDNLIKLAINAREKKYINSKYLIEGSLNEFEGNKCIISKRVSVDRKLKVGDKIDIILEGKNTQLTIAGIYGNEGAFFSDSKSKFALILPYEYVSHDLGVEGKYNIVLANKDGDSVKNSIKTFNNNNAKYKATQLFDEQAVKQMTSMITTVLYFMLTIVVFMSAIIIYGSFKLIITERMSVIGTFLSQGATKGTIRRILYLESIGYGLFGGIIGILFGIGGLNLINYLVSPLKDYGIYEKANINSTYYLIGIIFALLLSFVSALLPIIRIRKLQVKEVILNNINVSMSIGYKKFVIGLILTAASIFIAVSNKRWTQGISMLFVFVTFVDVVLIYPKLVDIVNRLLYKILRGRSKKLVLAINNIRTSKVLLGNTTLIIISVMSIFMISSLGTSLKKAVVGGYSAINYDVRISNISTTRQGEDSTDKEIVKQLETYKGYVNGSDNLVNNSFGTIDDNKTAFLVQGVDPEKYMDFMKYLELKSGINKDSYKDFGDGKQGIIITTVLSKRLKIKDGQTVKLSINGIEKDIKVIGTIEGKLYNNGYVVFISHKSLESIYGITGGDCLYINTNTAPAKFKKDIKPFINKYGVQITTKHEDLIRNNQDNQMIINVLSVFSFMAIIIASLGVLNNITIGFLQRKREIAVLASVGMQKKNRNMMLVLESIITAIWAIFISIPGSILLLKLLTKGLVAIEIPFTVNLDFSQIPYYAIVTIIIVLFATLPVLLRSRKLSIINELKYE